MIDAGIIVVRPAQDDDANAVLSLEFLQDFPALRTQDLILKLVLCLVAFLQRPRILFPGEPEHVGKLVIHLFDEQGRFSRIHKRVAEQDVAFLEDIPFLGERSLHRFRRGGHSRAGAMSLHVLHVTREIVDHGTENDVEWLLLVVNVQQVMDVRDPHLGRETRIDGPALGPFLVERFACVIGVDEVLRWNPERLEVGAEYRRHRVHVQDPGNADAQTPAAVHQLHALLLLRQEGVPGQGIGDHGRCVRLERRPGSYFGHIGIFFLHGVETLLDLAHVVHVLHQPLFTTVADDQPLDALEYRNFRLLP